MNTHYTATAKSLHWLMALLIFGLLALGFYMADLPLSPEKLQFYSWHKWAGVSVFVLVWLRLFWRVTHRPPAFAASLSATQQTLAHLGHLALYLLMIAIPVSGWLMSSAKGVQTVWFGVLPLPDLLGRDKALGKQLEELHSALNIGLLVLIGGHAAAALFHHLVHKDDTLRRMLPARTPSNT
ncbi:MAG: cytochrome b [Betaproteobacteria bacterium]